MAAQITLVHTVKSTSAGTVSLTMTTTGLNVASKVFAIEVLPASADTSAPLYRFSHICSPAELVEFPEDSPGDGCYFRTACVELIFDTDRPVQHVLDNVKKDLKRLVDACNALPTAPVIESSTTVIS